MTEEDIDVKQGMTVKDEATIEVIHKRATLHKEGFGADTDLATMMFRCFGCGKRGSGQELIDSKKNIETENQLRCPRCGSPGWMWIDTEDPGQRAAKECQKKQDGES